MDTGLDRKKIRAVLSGRKVKVPTLAKVVNDCSHNANNQQEAVFRVVRKGRNNVRGQFWYAKCPVTRLTRQVEFMGKTQDAPQRETLAVVVVRSPIP